MSDRQVKGGRILYGRRRGKPLRKGQKRLIESVLPKLAIPLNTDRLDLPSLFPEDCRSFWLEIGFGSGEHLAWQANANPEVGIIGCEPYINGVATLLGKLEEDGGQNVRLHNEAAEMLIEKLPESSIDRVFILFPDPWPKSGHNKRRFVSRSNIEALAQIMKSGAELRIGTDHTDYGTWILWHMLQSDKFAWIAESSEDWRERGADWPSTRYEMKAVEKGLRPVYYRFRRL
ncbi:tRNA (guanine(46)-N(7))-methyltransferase TrmB [Sneathiella litorea]|uniref:tRNA (guanine-N(7)-)-methyltransferase n=1 Tax=Sneathiella litorea TaxID=2606216 RepID=A0A6L8W527_9PROT|nr:tRNA (guanine(46)-N(7))-methyltransferase TrmB [Sneathiella litorea]MZR29593.1 tRNA (guanosine(46)-N7)-methyltransferase TrmB [Sneathiella litorea]